MMELNAVSWMPCDSSPIRDGWKSTSGHRNRSVPTEGGTGGGRRGLQATMMQPQRQLPRGTAQARAPVRHALYNCHSYIAVPTLPQRRCCENPRDDILKTP